MVVQVKVEGRTQVGEHRADPHPPPPSVSRGGAPCASIIPAFIPTTCFKKRGRHPRSLENKQDGNPISPPPPASSSSLPLLLLLASIAMAVPQQSYLQTKPFRNLLMDETQNQIPTPITFIGPASFTDHPQYVPSYHFMGPPVGQVHAGAEGADQQQQQLWGRNAREKELFENSQISSIDFLQHQGSVSTGLGLALDDRKLASSGDSPPMPLGFFEHEVSIELQRQEAEIDRFLKIQGERLRQAIVEKVQAQHLSILSLIEEQMLRKLQEQEAKVDELNLKNADLEERMKQLNIEAAAWQHHAKCNESMITTLKYNIQQVYAQSKECKEGCGDSEVNDAASRCDGGPEDMHILISKENKDLKEHMNCKVCRVNKVCMLLLPCRHLCLCKDCESKLSFCPLCQSSKFVGMEVYM